MLVLITSEHILHELATGYSHNCPKRQARQVLFIFYIGGKSNREDISCLKYQAGSYQIRKHS